MWFLNRCFLQNQFCDCALRALGLLLADGARTVGRGKTFWRVNRIFFYENCCYSGTESKKSYPRWEMNGHSEGYKRAIDQNWGRMAKIVFFVKNRDFGPKKKSSLLDSNHVLATTGKSCSNIKVAFSQINISLLRNFGCFFGLKPIFGQKNTFWPNVKTSVSP